MIQKLKCIAADIDMTLTFKGGDLHPDTINAFNELHSKGVKIGLATGRELTDRIKEQGKNWGLDFEFDFLIGMNGGMLFDRETGREWAIELLSREQLHELLEYLLPWIEKYKIAVNAEGAGNRNAMNVQGELLASAKRHGFDFVDVTGDVDAFAAKPAYKILLRMNAEHEQEMRKVVLDRFGDRYQVVGTFPGTVEVLQKGVSKGNGLDKYAGWKDLKPEEIMTFGDNENDESMLEYAGWGVCMADGSEKTKKCADALTDGGYEEGGVGRYLLNHCMNIPNH